MNKKSSGFTIVELIIVIVVIAVLAVISSVAYTNIQNRAHNSAVQRDLRNLATKFELYKAEFGTYPRSFTAQMGLAVSKSAYETDNGIHTSPPPVYNLLYCLSADSTRFALIARAKSGDAFQFADGSVDAYPGSVPANAGPLCSGAGIAGAVAQDRIWLYNAGVWPNYIGG